MEDSIGNRSSALFAFIQRIQLCGSIVGGAAPVNVPPPTANYVHASVLFRGATPGGVLPSYPPVETPLIYYPTHQWTVSLSQFASLPLLLAHFYEWLMYLLKNDQIYDKWPWLLSILQQMFIIAVWLLPRAPITLMPRELVLEFKNNFTTLWNRLHYILALQPALNPPDDLPPKKRTKKTKTPTPNKVDRWGTQKSPESQTSHTTEAAKNGSSNMNADKFQHKPLLGESDYDKTKRWMAHHWFDLPHFQCLLDLLDCYPELSFESFQRKSALCARYCFPSGVRLNLYWSAYVWFLQKKCCTICGIFISFFKTPGMLTSPIQY